MATHRWPEVLPDVFRGSAAVREQLLTPTQLRNRRRLVPVLHDVYRPVSVPPSHELKSRAAALVAPSSARLTGRSLATVLGVSLSTTEDPVTMVAPEGTGARIKGVVIREASAGPLGTSTWQGRAVTTPYRMGFDLAARQAPEFAVAWLDAVARAGLLDLDGFRAWLGTRFEDDVVAVRAAAALADPRAESVPESRCRVRLVVAGFEVTPQVVVRDGRGFVARVDLALERLCIAIEYDGAWHGALAQVGRDRERLNRLREAGWVVVHVTAEMLRDPHALVLAVQGAVMSRQAA